MDRGSDQSPVRRAQTCVLRCSLCVMRAKGTGAVRCKRWHHPRGRSHHVSARGSALFATILRQRRAAAGAHRGRRSSGSIRAHLLGAARCAPCRPYVRRSVHSLAPSRRAIWPGSGPWLVVSLHLWILDSDERASGSTHIGVYRHRVSATPSRWATPSARVLPQVGGVLEGAFPRSGAKARRRAL